MGKRKSNIGGLARFVLEANNNTPEPFATSSSISVTPAQGAADSKNEENILETPEPRPKKKQKLRTGLLGSGLERIDATGLVPFYTEASQVPEHLQKYFSQRERFFSLYSSGCLLDEEGWYSVTPEKIADQIAERCRCDVVLDAFCGVGGNAIAFAKTCERVIALDVSPIRLALARHNAALYGVEDRIEFVLMDFFSFARTLNNAANSSRARRKIDAVFLSPPWGGPAYLAGSPTKASAKVAATGEEGEAHADYSLESIRPVHGAELFKIARGITKNIAYFLPRNSNLEEISALVKDSSTGAAVEKVEVEEEWMGTKLKALTCYFGGFVTGQENMFEA
ncbi:S-adenosyl-L-methionine-dependent methyltransferase [Epithele typhae]|uniref:S-adenosyl-L-methionine-dependent methyltransferase n=1 Tax=Epithele typhae TaxID=378194 RepID=UPI002008D473|nr:S-adenosyl-L-methionine-dependent methyltransferase [Epithele typhae]KAH9940769.1 S-adenosyl-L-methionine-dependent methyltransferase [Epithele typhae]